MFPDVVGLQSINDIFAVEKNSYPARGMFNFERAFGGEPLRKFDKATGAGEYVHNIGGRMVRTGCCSSWRIFWICPFAVNCRPTFQY